MNYFIYNIVSICITLLLIYTGNIVEAKAFYIILCLGAIFITYLMNNKVLEYTTCNSKLREALKLIFLDEYKMRLSNYIGSYIVHALIILMLIGTTNLIIAISAVMIYRVASLIKNHKFILTAGKR
ncbi:hypothetical protein [Yersinia phage fHe-Yen9-04]|uniref:Uncharacterized protein n=2 Tax=Eneladusvirus Yen904 TaxID=2560849 RepID=A0A2C9CX58_9CAUD|nr:membrane protein [Yersinia phage fHe-Yen9-04]SOK58584.1 hypothetical protein [Yersinia phage fHe-Yen9-04]SOK59118.1 hypothetical protein [Yersinia phage fHe-Yen9-03]VUE36353.1 hypothetical protein [Yersinia phage fHe-Yen9-04]